VIGEAMGNMNMPVVRGVQRTSGAIYYQSNNDDVTLPFNEADYYSDYEQRSTATTAPTSEVDTSFESEEAKAPAEVGPNYTIARLVREQFGPPKDSYASGDVASKEKLQSTIKKKRRGRLHHGRCCLENLSIVAFAAAVILFKMSLSLTIIMTTKMKRRTQRTKKMMKLSAWQRDSIKLSYLQ
jgi:hypothetical protein